MLKIIICLLTIYVFSALAETPIPLSQMVNPVDGFNLRFNGGERKAWEQQRSNIAQELARRTEFHATQYNNALQTRAEFVGKAQAQATEIAKIESTYKPYQKGSGVEAFRSQELRLQLQQTLNTVDRLNVDVQNSFRSLERAASKLERFSQQSNFAKTTTAQVNLMTSPMGRNIMTHVNSLKSPISLDVMKGMSVGIPTNTLPTNLTDQGKIKVISAEFQYKAGETIAARSPEGGLVKGRFEGMTPKGELVIKETLPPNLQNYKQGEYRVIRPETLSSIAFMSPTANIAIESLSDPNKLKNVARIIEIRPTETTILNRIREFIGRPPALNNTNNQQPINPARPAIGGGGMR